MANNMYSSLDMWYPRIGEHGERQRPIGELRVSNLSMEEVANNGRSES
jgi:hypothetical protein